MAVSRLGPVVGGALAGMPIILGPGFFFLLVQAPPEFVSNAAAYALLSLCSTQIFLLTYIAAASRVGPPLSLLVALAAWGTTVGFFQMFPPQAMIGIALFVAVTVAARKLGARLVRATTRPTRAENLGLLLLRGILAGMLVAVVTASANQLGATASGLLLAFPIGYTVLSITIHEQFTAETVIATLHSAILGTISLAGFCASLALALHHMPPIWAFLFALAVSLVMTIALVLRSWLGRA